MAQPVEDVAPLNLDDEKPPFICPSCDQSLGSKSAIVRHCKNKHGKVPGTVKNLPDDDRSGVCPHCKRRYARVSRHVKNCLLNPSKIPMNPLETMKKMMDWNRYLKKYEKQWDDEVKRMTTECLTVPCEVVLKQLPPNVPLPSSNPSLPSNPPPSEGSSTPCTSRKEHPGTMPGSSLEALRREWSSDKDVFEEICNAVSSNEATASDGTVSSSDEEVDPNLARRCKNRNGSGKNPFCLLCPPPTPQVLASRRNLPQEDLALLRGTNMFRFSNSKSLMEHKRKTHIKVNNVYQKEKIRDLVSCKFCKKELLLKNLKEHEETRYHKQNKLLAEQAKKIGTFEAAASAVSDDGETTTPAASFVPGPSQA